MKNKKVLFYNKMNELIEMGFDLEKNSALDLISAVYELIEIEEKENTKGFKNIMVNGEYFGENVDEAFEYMAKIFIEQEKKKEKKDGK